MLAAVVVLPFRRMRTSKKIVLGALVAVAVGVGVYASPRNHSADSKLLVGRIWVDHLPTKDTEHFEVFLALSEDPIGIFQRRSQFEGSFALFRYELRGDDKVQLLFPQDKSKHDVKYDARKCDVKNFDYCLDLSGAPRGAKRYLSRKEWELDAHDLAELSKKLDAWQAALPVETTPAE